MLSFNESAWGGWWMIPVFPVCGVQGTLRSSSHRIAWQPHTPVTLEQFSCGENEAQRVNMSSKRWQVVCGGAGTQPHPHHCMSCHHYPLALMDSQRVWAGPSQVISVHIRTCYLHGHLA